MDTLETLVVSAGKAAPFVAAGSIATVGYLLRKAARAQHDPGDEEDEEDGPDGDELDNNWPDIDEMYRHVGGEG